MKNFDKWKEELTLKQFAELFAYAVPFCDDCPMEKQCTNQKERTEGECLEKITTWANGEAPSGADATLAALARRATVDTLVHFVDPRDGQVYRTVKMPDGRVWMAQNLNYECLEESYWYEDHPANGAKYGRLYTCDAAMKACPAGWHLPTRQEWKELVNSIGVDGGKKLKSTVGWAEDDRAVIVLNTDEYRFKALPGGRRFSDGSFSKVGEVGYWWSATAAGEGLSYFRIMAHDNEYIDESIDFRSVGFSVRCVRDSIEASR